MTSGWRRHWIVCGCLGALALPLCFVDRALFAPRGGWIALDFRGLLFWSYLLWFGIYLVLSSAALRLSPAAGKLWPAVGIMLLSLLLLLGGTVGYSKARDLASRRQDRLVMERRQARFHLLELKSWQYFPNEASPAEIRARVEVQEAGRFAGTVQGESTDAAGNTTLVFESANEPQDQRAVQKGDRFVYTFPLKSLHPGRPDHVSITLYLFHAASGAAQDDITKVFSDITAPTADDGRIFYAPLPAPERSGK